MRVVLRIPLIAALAAVAVWELAAAPARASCVVPSAPEAEDGGEPVVSLEEIVSRIGAERVKYVFVGERHGIGPVKRFAVDLANSLVESGLSVGLYVEGFRTNCSPREESCWSIARAFNSAAFLTLLDHSAAPVHAIDPPEPRGRASRMAEAIAAGQEEIRVVLLGKSHVVYPEEPEARFPIFGGDVAYPDPGDVAEAFPRTDYLTLGLETVERALGQPYRLRPGGCGVDYSLETEARADY